MSFDEYDCSAPTTRNNPSANVNVTVTAMQASSFSFIKHLLFFYFYIITLWNYVSIFQLCDFTIDQRRKQVYNEHVKTEKTKGWPLFIGYFFVFKNKNIL